MTVNRVAVWLAFCLTLLSAEVVACEMQVVQAYARATPPGASSAAVYLTLHNQADKKRLLVDVSSNRAKQVMIHQNQLQGDMMRMRQLSQLEIVAHSHFEFKPGDHHLMLTGLATPLRVGEQVQLKLQFDNGQVLFVRLPVLAVGDEIGAGRNIDEQMKDHLE